MIATIVTFLSEGFLLGLTLGTTCAASCGPMYMPYLMQREQTVTKSLINIVEISAGRFLSYIAFGMVAGSIGTAVNIVVDRAWFSSAAYILFSILLLISTFRTHQRHKGCSVSKWSKFADRPFFFGVLTGVSLCPSFFGALTLAFDAGGFIGGGSIFAGFFFGSTIFLLPFMLAGIAGNVKFFQKVAVFASVIVAAYFIGKGTMGFINLAEAHSHASSPATATNVINTLDETPLYIIDTSKESASLKELLIAQKSGEVFLQADTMGLPDSCHILIATEMLDTPLLLRTPGRFVVVLPQPNGTMTPQEYAQSISVYLNRYMFKRDDEHGTFFNMATFLDKGHKSHTPHKEKKQ